MWFMYQVDNLLGKIPLKLQVHVYTCIYILLWLWQTIRSVPSPSAQPWESHGSSEYKLKTKVPWHSGHWTVNQWMFWRVKNIIGQIWRLVVHVLQTLGTVSMWINNSLSRERHNITIINKKFANNTSLHLLYFSPCLN